MMWLLYFLNKNKVKKHIIIIIFICIVLISLLQILYGFNIVKNQIKKMFPYHKRELPQKKKKPQYHIVKNFDQKFL